MQQKRPKVKLRVRPWKSWLPEMMESLELHVEEYLEYIPKITKHQTLDDVFRLRCNHLSSQLTHSLHRVSNKKLREIYHKTCFVSQAESNKTFMISRIIYVICEALGLMTERMNNNYSLLLERGALKTMDIFGSSWKQEIQFKRKGGKASSFSKKPRKERGLTVTGTIEALLLREQGASKEEIIHELVAKFPERAEHAMKNTTSVQLSSHLKKKHGDKLRQIKPGRYQIVAG